jgi:hypothetical protein
MIITAHETTIEKFKESLLVQVCHWSTSASRQTLRPYGISSEKSNSSETHAFHPYPPVILELVPRNLVAVYGLPIQVFALAVGPIIDYYE